MRWTAWNIKIWAKSTAPTQLCPEKSTGPFFYSTKSRLLPPMASVLSSKLRTGSNPFCASWTSDLTTRLSRARDRLLPFLYNLVILVKCSSTTVPSRRACWTLRSTTMVWCAMPACLLPYLVQHIVILVKGAKSFFFSYSLVSREVLPDQYYIFLKIFSKRGRVKSILKIVANSRRPFGIKLTKKVRQKIVASMFKTRGSETFWKI